MDQLLPQFGNITFIILAFVVALSIIVAIHEYGHYIVGRWSGIDADVFSLGFGPVLWSRMDRRGTRWQVAALPLGGYVKFRGDADAASVTADTSVAPARNTMLGAPLWARSATVAAGPIFNFVLSALIFAGIFLFQGRALDPITFDSAPELPASITVELEQGDEVVAIAGLALADYPDDTEPMFRSLPEERVLTYTVLRDGTRIDVSGPHPNLPFAAGISPRSAADDAKLRPGDVVLQANGTEIATYWQLIDIVTGSEGRAVPLVIWRSGETLDIELTPRAMDERTEDGGFERNYRLGINLGLVFEVATGPRPFGESLWGGVVQVWLVIENSLSGLWHIIAGSISTCNLSGPVGIAETSGSMASQGLDSFIWFVAVLSTAVGLLNLFPIPVLDGGHLVFHAWEAVTGRPPSEGALRILMATGLSLILTLMLFALANDLFLCP